MSYITFQNKDDSIRIRGRERHYMGWLVSNICKPLIPDKHPYKDQFSLFNDDAFRYELNTIMSIGSDPLKLMARLHSQCEIHCWIAAEDIQWLKSIIAKGLQSDLYRKDMNWENLIKFIEDHPDKDIVCSYSVTESFPRPDWAVEIDNGECPYEKCDEQGLTHHEIWDRSMVELKKESGLRIRPSHFSDEFYYDKGQSYLNWSEEWHERHRK